MVKNTKPTKKELFQAFCEVNVATRKYYWLYIKSPFLQKKNDIPMPLSDELIKKHFLGEEYRGHTAVLGLSPFTDNKNVLHGLIDFDVHKPTDKAKELKLKELNDEKKYQEWEDKFLEEQRKQIKDDIPKIKKELQKLGYLHFVNSSGSEGRHLRVYSNKPTNAKIMRYFLLDLQERILGEVRHEVFPKQDELNEETPFGNQSKGVLAIHPKTKGLSGIIINDKVLDRDKSLQFIYEFSKKIPKAKEIKFKISPELEQHYKKKKYTEEELKQLDFRGIPYYCGGFEEVACKQILPSGKATRHDYLDGNAYQYLNDKPELFKSYCEIQGRDHTAFNKAEDWKFNCLTIHKYLRENTGEGIEKWKKLCQHCPHYNKEYLPDLKPLLECDDDLDKRNRIIKDILKTKVNTDPIDINTLIEQVGIITGIKETILKKQLESERKKIKEVESNTVTTTSPISTTFTSLNPAGHIEKGLVLEPLGKGRYIYNHNGLRGVSQAKYDEKTKTYFIQLGSDVFTFDDKPIYDKHLLFKVPSEEKIKKYISGNLKIYDINHLFKNLEGYISLLYDLTNKWDNTILSLGVLQSWLRDCLKATYFDGLDATRGAGKTSLLEFMSIVCRHGAVLGNLTPAFIGRGVERYKLTGLIDEIDELHPEKKAEIEGILRKGQRRNNPYVRVNKNTGELESHDVFSYYVYSFRKTVEDAFMSRTILHRLRVTTDKTLPILNYYKETIGFPLFEDLFFWFMENVSELKELSSKSSEVGQVGGVLDSNEDFKNIFELRQKLFKIFTKQFSKEEINLINELVGRNIELCFIALLVCKLLKLDIFESIRQGIKEKQTSEEVPEQFYLDVLISYLKDLYTDSSEMWFLKKGEFTDNFYYPRSKAFRGFVSKIKGENLLPIGTDRFYGYIKDIGFIHGINLKNQKDKGDDEKKPTNKPTLCLIYDRDIINKLGITKEEEESKLKEIREERKKGETQKELPETPKIEEETIEDTEEPAQNNKDKILSLIPSKNTVPTAFILSHIKEIPEATVMTILEKERTEGGIFNPSPDFWKRLE